MSAIDIAGDAASVAAVSSDSSFSTSKSGLAVDSDMFLSLLVAQLKYQDPLSPQSDTEFVTQLAQMSSLEEMQEINSGMASLQAYSMVGKYAYAESQNSEAGKTDYFYGTIDSIVNSKGTFYAIIGEDAVKVDDIQQVFDSGLIGTGKTLVESSDLIGRTVTGVYENDGAFLETEGEVTAVAWEDGAVCVYIGEIRIPLDGITAIK